ncbi:MAG TPA: hypothetical protein VMF29_00940, partial [Candidatus Edwardsbacteria bacterium]|nr:hypothetical protein [Candidatus Edwardsbacteria bacterium]
RDYPDQPLAPKALYAAAWASERFLADTAAADSLYRGVIETWPSTRYANGARDRLGLPLDGSVDDVEPDIEFKATAAPAAADTANPAPAKQAPGQDVEPENPKDQQQPPPDQPPDKKMIPGPDDLQRKSETR